MDMNATKKGIIGMIIGAIIPAAIIIIMAGMNNSPASGTLSILPYMPLAALVGALYGFGYAFGWKLGVRGLGKALGVAGATSFFIILFSRDRRSGFMWSLVIFIFAISFTLGFAYIPGIYIGIRDIVRERRILKA